MAHPGDSIPLSFPVSGPGGIAQIEQTLRKTAVFDVRVDSQAGSVHLAYDPARTDAVDLLQTLNDAGYRVPVQAAAFRVTGMTCLACVARIEGALLDLPGVVDAHTNLKTGETTVRWISDGDGILSNVKTSIQKLGYGLSE